MKVALLFIIAILLSVVTDVNDEYTAIDVWVDREFNSVTFDRDEEALDLPDDV